MRKRRLCVKMSPRAAAKTALQDIQLIAKSKYHLVNYTTIGWAMREHRDSWHFCQLTPTESFLGAAVWLLPFVCAVTSTVWGCGIEWETFHHLSLQPCPLKPMCQPPPSGKVVRVGRSIVGSNPGSNCARVTVSFSLSSNSCLFIYLSILMTSSGNSCAVFNCANSVR